MTRGLVGAGPARAVLGSLRGALWPIPALAVTVAIGLGIGLPALDEVLERPGGNPLTFVFGGGPAAARDVLAAISGSLISVTGLTFSLTVVALQLAGSQYSPRVLQTFVTDRAVQLTLAQLTATFVYALTVLRTVRTESATSGGDPAFVPRLSITVAYLLTLISVIALVLFLGHLARLLRVETMLRDIHDEAHVTIGRELPEAGTPADSCQHLPPRHAIALPASSSGFLIDVDEELLVTAATEAGAVVLLGARFGDSVVTGIPVAHAWPAGPGVALDVDRVQEALDRALQLDFERRPTRDVAYSLRKVVDIAVRALSPGINDPTTAVHALSHASALVGDLLQRPLHASVHRDPDDVVRLVVPQWSPTDLLELALEEPLQFASGQPAVLRRLAGMLREVAWRAPRGALDTTLRQRLRRVVDLAAESTEITAEERYAWELRFEQARTGQWPPEPPAGTIATDGGSS